jgi:hypothetical protein
VRRDGGQGHDQIVASQEHSPVQRADIRLDERIVGSNCCTEFLDEPVRRAGHPEAALVPRQGLGSGAGHDAFEVGQAQVTRGQPQSPEPPTSGLNALTTVSARADGTNNDSSKSSETLIAVRLAWASRSL